MSLEIFLMALVLAAATLVAASRMFKKSTLVIAGCVIFALTSAIAGIFEGEWRRSERDDAAELSEDQIENRPVEVAVDGYVSSDKCRACHPHHYDSWYASHHRTMTQVPTKESVVADFDDHTIRHSGQEFRFFEKEDKYWMEIKSQRLDPKGRTPSKIFELVLSTGAHHQQAFWCQTAKGRSLGKLPFIWINSEQRWIPYGSIFFMPSSGLSMRVGLWNKSCIECHVVSGRPRSEPEYAFDSHVAEFGISCEACHGPGEEHVKAHRNPVNRYRHHLSSQDDPTLISPADLSHERSSQVCGQCHSVFTFYDEESRQEFDRKGFEYRPGDDLNDSRLVVRYEKDERDPAQLDKLHRQFWFDGMVRVSGREFNGLLETPCYQHGAMSCLSCHTMHSRPDDKRPRNEWADDQLKPNMRGNEACVQCHEEFGSEIFLQQHTHHQPDSSGSNCYNCHMPHTTLGLMKAMRSHTVDSPNVATTLATGRPNACNLCHLDKTLAWTSEKLSNWYGIEPPQLSLDETEIASSIRWILQGDAGQRAIAGWHFGWKPAQEVSGTDWMPPYLAELLDDTYDVVRFIGFHSLKKLPAFANLEYDFVGSKEQRMLGKEIALEIFNALKNRPADSKPLLFDSDGSLMEQQFREIRNQRLDPPFILSE